MGSEINPALSNVSRKLGLLKNQPINEFVRRTEDTCRNIIL